MDGQKEGHMDNYRQHETIIPCHYHVVGCKIRCVHAAFCFLNEYILGHFGSFGKAKWRCPLEGFGNSSFQSQ